MKRQIVALIFVVVSALGISPGAIAAPGDAIASANTRSSRAEARFGNCGRKPQGQQVIDCVKSAVNTFATDVGSCSFIAAVAPQAAPAVSSAATSIGGASTKQAALSVLNRASSVLRGLAAQSSGEAQRVYSRIGRAFQTAINVINTKS